MKVKITVDCPRCDQKFETSKGFDLHRPTGRLTCLKAKELTSLGWTRNTSGVWRRPKGRR